MPSTISPGTRVKARVGSLQVETSPVPMSLESVATTPLEKPKRSRRVRAFAYGWVVGPGRPTSSNNSWRVLWTDCGKACDHTAPSLKVVTDVSPSFDESVFALLLPADYLPSTKALSNLYESGKYNNTLQLSEPAASSSITSINSNSGKYWYFADWIYS